MNEKIYTFIQKEDYQNLIRLELCGITYPNKNYSITRRSSKIACIEFIESGTGCVSIGREQFYPSQNDSYFLQSGFDQHYYSDSSNPWKKYFINISGPLLQSMTEGYGLEKHFYYPGLNIGNELLKIIELAKHKNCDCTKEIIGLLNEIFLKMHLHIQGTARNSLAAEIKNYLNTKIESDFQIKDLCIFIHKSESQVIKVFKNTYGLTPYKYLLDKKIEHAKNLLRNTNLSVKEISAKLKFTDEYYFSNIFKKKAGLCPSLYRKISVYDKTVTSQYSRFGGTGKPVPPNKQKSNNVKENSTL